VPPHLRFHSPALASPSPATAQAASEAPALLGARKPYCPVRASNPRTTSSAKAPLSAMSPFACSVNSRTKRRSWSSLTTTQLCWPPRCKAFLQTGASLPHCRHIGCRNIMELAKLGSGLSKCALITRRHATGSRGSRAATTSKGPGSWPTTWSAFEPEDLRPQRPSGMGARPSPLRNGPASLKPLCRVKHSSSNSGASAHSGSFCQETWRRRAARRPAVR